MDLLKNALQLRKDNQLEESRAVLLDLVQHSPEDPVALYQCAWAHDLLGLERDAVPFYTRALACGLEGDERRGAYVGLGSTLRALGERAQALEVLRQARQEFPDARDVDVFYALALYSAGEGRESVRVLLHNLVETTSNADITAYRRALLFYADRLDETWDS